MKLRWTILPVLARVSGTSRCEGLSSPRYGATLEGEASGTARAVAWRSPGNREVTQREREIAARAGAMGTGTRTTGTRARTTGTRARTTASGKREIEETAGGSATGSQKTSRPIFPRYAQPQS